MPNQFNSPEGDLENYFVSEYWLIDQWVGDTLWTWGSGASGQLGHNTTTNRCTPVTTFAGGSNWKQVACGDNAAAIKTDGTLWTWGGNPAGQLGDNTVVGKFTPIQTSAGGSNWKQVAISIGGNSTAAIKTDGTLWIWGQGTNGQLGDNTAITKSTPVTTFAGGTNWKQVANGTSHSAAVKTDGTLWTWGVNTNGQLGDNTTTTRSTPVTTFLGGTNWKQVACGQNHTAAIKTDGTLWTWGQGSSGQLGDNIGIARTTPVTTIVGGSNWKQVSCGSNHTAAIKTDGTLWTWGLGANGQLGRNSDAAARRTPITTFAGGTNWADTATGAPEELYTFGGYNYTVAIKTDGTLWAWGQGTSGQLGDNAAITRSTPVTTFLGGTNWKQVGASGGSHVAAIKTDGTLWTWGANSNGQLGDNTAIARSTPVQTFLGGTDWKQVATGGNSTAAVKTDGTLWTWGQGTNGQLGDNTVISKSTPVQTSTGGSDWKQVACGQTHTAAIKTDGTLWTWGINTNGQLGDNTVITKSTPVQTSTGGSDWKQVACGANHTAAIKTDGTLWTWGASTSGQLGDNTTISKSTPIQTSTGGTNWKQVACGGQHTAAVKTDGTLWNWGQGTAGQLGDNTITNKCTPVTTFAGGTNWKQVACGFSHTMALNDDGINKQLYVWGNNNGSQLGTNWLSLDLKPAQTFAGGTNWKQVSCGNAHTAAIKTDGTLWTWGQGTSGQLGDNTVIAKSTPVTTFLGGTNWKQVAASTNITVAVTSGTDPTYFIS